MSPGAIDEEEALTVEVDVPEELELALVLDAGTVDVDPGKAVEVGDAELLLVEEGVTALLLDEDTVDDPRAAVELGGRKLLLVEAGKLLVSTLDELDGGVLVDPAIALQLSARQ